MWFIGKLIDLIYLYIKTRLRNRHFHNIHNWYYSFMYIIKYHKNNDSNKRGIFSIITGIKKPIIWIFWCPILWIFNDINLDLPILQWFYSIVIIVFLCKFYFHFLFLFLRKTEILLCVSILLMISFQFPINPEWSVGKNWKTGFLQLVNSAHRNIAYWYIVLTKQVTLDR